MTTVPPAEIVPGDVLVFEILGSTNVICTDKTSTLRRCWKLANVLIGCSYAHLVREDGAWKGRLSALKNKARQ